MQVAPFLIAAGFVALVVAMFKPDQKWAEVAIFLVGLAVLAIVWIKP